MYVYQQKLGVHPSILFATNPQSRRMTTKNF